MYTFDILGFRLSLSLETAAEAIDRIASSPIIMPTEDSLAARVFQPQTAFTVACLGLTVLAVISVWQNRESVGRGGNGQEKRRSILKKESQQVRFEDADGRNEQEQPDATKRDAFAEGESHISRISHLTSVCANLSGTLHSASIGTDTLRSQMPILLDELSGMIGVLCQIQQLLAKDPTCFSSKTGLAAVFETTSTGILSTCATTREECAQGTKPGIGYLLSQIRNYRSTLDFLYTNLELQSPMENGRPTSRSGHVDPFVPGHKRSLTVPTPQHSGPVITPGTDAKKWLESPPESESSIEEQLPEYSALPDTTQVPQSNTSVKRNVVSLSDIHGALSEKDSHGSLQKLLSTGVDPNAIYGRLSRTALQEAARLNESTCISLLIQSGALVDANDSKGDTALHLASWEGHVESCAALLSAGADIDRLSGRDACTPLFCAIGGKHIDLVRLLIKRGARVSMKSPTEMYPLHQASVTGQPAICDVLLRAGAQIDGVDKDKNTPLHYAATVGKVDTIALLLKHGARVDAKQEQRMTPLHWTCHRGHEGALRALLDAGAEVNERADEDVTPLCCAASRGHVGCVKLLLRRGADRRIACSEWDGGKGTPAQLAKRNGHREVVALLQSYRKS